jgi:hypothetical protein
MGESSGTKVKDATVIVFLIGIIASQLVVLVMLLGS